MVEVYDWWSGFGLGISFRIRIGLGPDYVTADNSARIKS